MNLWLPNATLIYPGHPKHGQVSDVWLCEGKLFLQKPDGLTFQQLDNGLLLSPGWVDLQARAYEPGHEARETIASLTLAGKHGGFTALAVLPNTNPVVDGREGVTYLAKQGQQAGMHLLPIGAVTQHSKGEKLAEMLDMHQAGAVAYSDGKPLTNPDIVLKTLQYLQHIDGLLIQRPEDPLLSAFGLMNQGFPALMLGLEGIPHLAEEVMVSRDLQLLEHAGGKLHFSKLSTPVSLAMVQQAKAKGLQVTCSMAAHQLNFNHEHLAEFDTNLKISPPYRSAEVNEMLKQALLDGLIDAVESDHQPTTIEQKKCEFGLAEFGISSVETAFLSLLDVLGHGNIDKVVEMLAIGLRKVLSLPLPLFEHGEEADFTIFSSKETTEITPDYFVSKSGNSPFLGITLQGRVVGTYVKGIWNGIEQATLK